MKAFSNLLFFFVSFLALSVGVAEAAPVVAFAGTLLSGAAFGGGVAGAIGAFAARSAISVGMSALAGALSPKQRPGGGGIETDVTLSGDDVSQSTIFGTYATAGTAITPPYAYGYDGDDDQEYLTYIIAVSDTPITSLEYVIIDGEKFTLQPQRVVGQANYDEDDFYGQRVNGRLDGNCFIRFHDGTQTTADSVLVDRLGNYPERPWTTAHILKGVAYVAITFKYRQKKFNGLPDCKFIVKGMKLYDPRKDSSVGGSGAHRWNNKATWEHTENPIVQTYNVIRGISLADGSIYGLNADAGSMPLDRWFVAMNVCDQPGTGGVDSKRYRASLEIPFDVEPLDVIDNLMRACGGQIAEHGGYYNVTAGAPPASKLTFSDDQIIISEEREFTVTEGISQTFNGVTASFPDPNALWETKDAHPFYNAAWEAEDDGRRLIADLKLSAVPYPHQVRRLMRELASDNRRQRKHIITLGPWALGLLPLDTITWTSPNNGYSNKLFEIVSKTIDPLTLNSTFGIRERDPSDYNYNAAFDGVLPVVPSIARVPIILSGVAGFNATAILINDAQGRPRRPAIVIAWSPDIAAPSVSYEIRHATTGQIVASDTTSDVTKGQVIVAGALTNNTPYEVRARVVHPKRDVNWSAWIPVTTGAASIVNDDFVEGIQKLFRDQDMSAIEYFPTLPTTGAKNQTVYNTSDGKLYRWVLTPAPAKWVPVVENALTGVLDETHFATGISVPRSVSTLPTTGNYQGRLVTLSTNGKVYRYHNGAWTASVPSVDITGQLTDSQIAGLNAAKLAGQITSPQIADAAIASDKIAAGAVDALRLANNAVTTEKISAYAIGADQIAANAIVASKVAIGDFTNLVTDSQIQDAQYWTTVGSGLNVNLNKTYGDTAAGAQSKGAFIVTNPGDGPATIIDSGITPIEPGKELFVSARSGATANCQVTVGFCFRDNTGALIGGRNWSPVKTGTGFQTITHSAVAPANARSVQLSLQVLAGQHPATGHVAFTAPILRLKSGGELIVDGAITTSKLGVGAVTANTIAANAVSTTHLTAGAVTTTELAANAVTAQKIAAYTIGADQIAANAITSNKIDTDAITAGKIAAGAVGADQIAAGAILASKIGVLDIENKVPDDQIQDANAWSYSSNTIRHQPTTPHGNIKSVGSFLYVNADNAARGDMIAMTKGFFPVTPGDVLYLSGQMIRSGGTKMYARCQILYYDKFDSLLSANSSYGFAVVNGTQNTHVPYTGEHTVPAGAFQARFRFYVHGGANETDGNIYFGAPVVRTKNKGEMIVDGTITGNKIVAQTITGGLLATSGIITNAAQMNNAVITNAKIANLAVDTLKIADNAATVTFAVNNRILNIDLAYAASILIIANCRINGITNGYTANYQLLRNGVEIDFGNYSVSPYTWRNTIQKVINCPAGSHIIRIEYSGNQADYSEHRLAVLATYK